jgi:hypothetical protein
VGPDLSGQGPASSPGLFLGGTSIAELRSRRLTLVNWFNLSIVGWIIVIIALAIAAYMLHMAAIWIAIGALALLGIGIIASVAKSKPQV